MNSLSILLKNVLVFLIFKNIFMLQNFKLFHFSTLIKIFVHYLLVSNVAIKQSGIRHSHSFENNQSSFPPLAVNIFSVFDFICVDKDFYLSCFSLEESSSLLTCNPPHTLFLHLTAGFRWCDAELKCSAKWKGLALEW